MPANLPSLPITPQSKRTKNYWKEKLCSQDLKLQLE
uniref:Uncharacterized protein n=1 Tax=Arundo donax TaxID=35708 RepID=A0A0A8XXA0_ARUDO